MNLNIAVPIPTHDSRWTWPINVGPTQSTLGVTAAAAYATSSSWPILTLSSTSCPNGSTTVPAPTPWAPGFHEHQFASFYDPVLSTSIAPLFYPDICNGDSSSASRPSHASHRSDPSYAASTSTRPTPAPVHSTRPNVNISFGNPNYPRSLQPTSPSHVVTSQRAYTSANTNTPHTPVPSSSSLAEPAAQYDRTSPLAGSTPQNLPSFSWLEPLASTADSLRSTSHPASSNSAHPINRNTNTSILTPPSVNPIIQPPPSVPGSNQPILTYHVHQSPFSTKLRNSASFFFRGQFYQEQAFSFGQTGHVEPDRLDLYLDSDDNHVDSWFMERWGPIPILPSHNRRRILQDSSMRFASRQGSTGTTARFVIEDVLQGIANYFQQGMSIEEIRLAKQMIGERTLREERQRRWDHSDSNENNDRILHLSGPEGRGVSGFEPAYLRCDVLRGRLKFGGIYLQRMGDGTRFSYKMVLRLLPMRRVRFAL
ncbi:hypothetical protein K435DRAFT_841184 [Dendrothele bispora CBS 962.96]|uniref:Uncharacterized protein n=1 Tax=Dendrothele bispora (strain CBS 962.96) TaxID=1314807 RepID=A0A4S8LP11_DENBC|nr:hypothetical protein K435DRAFT_841184 [Dendrothele bispora CBS 962.96]